MTEVVELTEIEVAVVSGGQTWWEWWNGTNEPGTEEPTGIKG